MGWKTIYETARFAFDAPFFLLLLLLIGVSFTIKTTIQCVKTEQQTIGGLVAQLAISAILIFVGLFLIASNIDNLFDGTGRPAAKAYFEGNYEVIEGKSENESWGNVSCSFTVAETNFISDMYDLNLSLRTLKKYLDGEHYLRVYYYPDRMYDETIKQYTVVRIDVLAD